MGKKLRKQAGSKRRTGPEQSKKSELKLLTALILAVCILTVITHWPALSARAMSFDDNMYLTENQLVRNPGLTSARRFLTEILEPSSVRGYYQPLTMISLMADCAAGAGPENLMPIHRTSLIFHAANTALIIVLLYILFGRPVIAAAVGLLFGVHPLTVELVAWVSDRKDLLATFFTLWCFIFYVFYARKQRLRFLAGSFAMYVLALMSKPTSVPVPILLLVMDFWPLRRLRWKVLPEKLPFFAAAGVFAVVTVISQARTALVVMPGEAGYDFARLPLIICHNTIFYLHKIIRPVNLSLFYPFPEPFGFYSPLVLAGVIGSLILAGLLVLSLRWTKVAVVGWLFFIIAILPTMNLIKFTKVIAADRYVYFPSLGLLMLLAAFLIWLFDRAAVKRRDVTAVIVFCVVIILACGEAAATRRYLFYWADSAGFFRHLLTIAPDAPQVHKALAYILARRVVAAQPRANPDEAVAHYKKALELRPNDLQAMNNLGDLLMFLGRFDDAVGYFHQALQLNPDYLPARNNLSNALQLQGKTGEAVENYLYALKLAPDSADIHYNLANALYSIGKTADAVKHYKLALKTEPDDVSARCNLADTLRGQGKIDGAIEQYRLALQIEPDNVAALNGLAWVLVDNQQLKPDDPGNAVALAGRAAELTAYENPVILNTLARAYAADGQLDMAKRTAQRALELARRRQNQELVDYIQNQLEHYSRRRP